MEDPDQDLSVEGSGTILSDFSKHPYDTPQILAWKADSSTDFTSWVEAESSSVARWGWELLRPAKKVPGRGGVLATQCPPVQGCRLCLSYGRVLFGLGDAFDCCRSRKHAMDSSLRG